MDELKKNENKLYLNIVNWGIKNVLSYAPIVIEKNIII